MSEAAEALLKNHVVRIRRMNDEERTVEGLVYEPMVLDTYGEMMLPEDVKIMAHRYMSELNIRRTIDTNHDEISNGSYPVESFIARKGDPDYAEGAWVMKVYVPEDDIWQRIKKGDINGYSFQAMVCKFAAVVEMEVDMDHFGVTEPMQDHEHLYWAELNADGVIVGGRTSTVNGHAHDILGGTVTEKAFAHVHRLPA